jgi:hypothetical protein
MMAGKSRFLALLGMARLFGGASCGAISAMSQKPKAKSQEPKAKSQELEAKS